MQNNLIYEGLKVDFDIKGLFKKSPIIVTIILIKTSLIFEEKIN